MLARMGVLPEALQITEGQEQLIIPSVDLFVFSLMAFELPPQHKSIMFVDPSDYLSDLPLTLTTFNVRDIPMPPMVVVKALSGAIISDPETKSILLVHSPAHHDNKKAHYPLWLATIWSMLALIRDSQTVWCAAADQVHANLEESTTSEATASRAKAALQALNRLSWDCSIKCFHGGSSVENLVAWFTTDWLNTDHEDQTLELLAADLGLSHKSTSTINSTHFAVKLGQVYSCPDEYQTAEEFQWLRWLGTVFAMRHRERLGTIVNIHNIHWVALTIDYTQNIVGYRDRFGNKAPKFLCKSLDW
ncbi:hypothetical protein B0H14DRAFT_3713219 [Mycena olivaceomarginata]|nr:hypothetical protein B0H14DRAFT_3713219 [Mycena olivaceomarginata]